MSKHYTPTLDDYASADALLRLLDSPDTEVRIDARERLASLFGTHEALVKATREIAAKQPEDPGDEEFDGDTEDAESHGVKLGHFDASCIAQQALRKIGASP